MPASQDPMLLLVLCMRVDDNYHSLRHSTSSISYQEVTTLTHWEAFAKIGQLTSALATHPKQNLSSEAKLQSQTQVLQALPPPGSHTSCSVQEGRVHE